MMKKKEKKEKISPRGGAAAGRVRGGGFEPLSFCRSLLLLCSQFRSSLTSPSSSSRGGKREGGGGSDDSSDRPTEDRPTCDGNGKLMTGAAVQCYEFLIKVPPSNDHPSTHPPTVCVCVCAKFTFVHGLSSFFLLSSSPPHLAQHTISYSPRTANGAPPYLALSFRCFLY